MTASLAYRKNVSAIRAGNPPEKYLRILPHIPGERIIEIGSAEGVLACLLAREKAAVTAVEPNRERHAAALDLHAEWQTRFKFTCAPRFVLGKIGDHLDLFDGVDTLVAVRSIYYLGERLDEIFAAAAAKVPHIVLCGNANRARRYHQGNLDAPLGEMNYYASAEGMRDLLTRHGYRIADEVAEGDAIVVGTRA